MTFTDLFLDQHLDLILRASGSALKHWSMQKTKDDMRVALRSAVEAANAELRKERDELLQENRMLLEAYAVELEQRLAGQVPSPAAKGYGLEYLQHKREQSHAAVGDELVQALRDHIFALQFRPSCQAGVVDKCRCIACTSFRLGDAESKPAPTSAGVPDGYSLVSNEILDRFPEINPSNYDHDGVCDLNAWGVELVLSVNTQPAADGGGG